MISAQNPPRKQKLAGKGPETGPDEEYRHLVSRAGMQTPQVSLAARLKTNRAKHSTVAPGDKNIKTLSPMPEFYHPDKRCFIPQAVSTTQLIKSGIKPV